MWLVESGTDIFAFAQVHCGRSDSAVAQIMCDLLQSLEHCQDWSVQSDQM